VLLSVSECLRSWASFTTGSERLLRELADALGQTAAALWLPDGDALVARTVWASDGINRPVLEEFFRTLRLPRGSGLTGHAWTHAEPVTAGSTARARTIPIGGLRGTVGVPALAGADVICVIELYSTSTPDLGQEVMRVLGTVAHHLGAFFSRRRGELGLSSLTAREVQVLALAAHGLPVGTIGEQLNISRGTVKSHLEHIYTKLGVVNRTAGVAHALRSGLIE
jgi:DNA-binding CsgD family transcriptional regulator